MRKQSEHINYERIAKAIEYVVLHVKEQPSLDDIAKSVSMSKYHFQRIFTEWAGVTPKQFLEHLTVESLKKEILETRSILEASANVGLSSQSRAYDLMVHIEAMTPGEYKKLGEGLQIEYDRVNTPFGEAFIAITQRGICAFEFIDNNFEEVLQEVKAKWNKALFIAKKGVADSIISALFPGISSSVSSLKSLESSDKFQLNLLLKGSPFQIKVWRALLSIPSSHVATYSEIAKLIHQEKAVRAVASAIAKNPIGCIIPCHRIIRKEGAIGQYHWGSTRKSALIAWEKSKDRK